MGQENWDANWLVFSGKARRGSLIFLLIFVFFGVGYKLLFASHSTRAKYTYFEIMEVNPILLDTLHKGSSKEESLWRKKIIKRWIPDSLFNPNDFEANDWMKMGFSQKQTATILKFKDRIGGFKSKRDIENLFVMTDDLYRAIHPLILLPDSLNRLDYSNRSWPKPEVNSASEIQLKRIKGIGPFYAHKILSYRNALGGFYQLDQLKEINQFSEELIAKISTEMELNQKNIVRLNINVLDESGLAAHPYIRISVARDIIRLRNEKGAFSRVDEVMESPLMNEQLFGKLKYYLTTDEDN